MPVTRRRAESPNPVTLIFNSELFDKRMAKLGHHTEQERARAIGVHRGSLHRIRNQPALSHKQAVEIATFIGVKVTNLFLHQPAEHQADRAA